MFKLVKLVRNTELSIKTSLKLYDQLVRPVVMYGADIWGVPNLKVNAFVNDRYGFGLEELYENFPCESVQLMFCKMLLGVQRIKRDLRIKTSDFFGHIRPCSFDLLTVTFQGQTVFDNP